MEYQENGLNTLDFHARMYDPQIGRTFQPDPHADSYAAKSPFSFLANNPIMFTDPTGMDEVEDGTSSGGSDPGSLFPGSATGNSGSWFTGSGKSFRGAGGFYAAFNARGQWRAEKGRSNWIDRMPRYKFEVVDRYKDWYEGSEYNGYHYKNTTYQGQYFLLSYVQGEGGTWDLNKDGKFQKNEADNWWLHGGGKAVFVNNANINWDGLKIPEGASKGSIFAISTTDAFLKLPYETAATYGGTSFKVVSPFHLQVLNQLYHYSMRPNNSMENRIRNFLTTQGKPEGTGTDYMIHYFNPIILIK